MESQKDLSRMKVSELKALVKQKKIPKYYQMNKAKLVEVLKPKPILISEEFQNDLSRMKDLAKQQKIQMKKKQLELLKYNNNEYSCKDCFSLKINTIISDSLPKKKLTLWDIITNRFLKERR